MDFFASMSRSSKRDRVNAFSGFTMHDRNGNPLQQTQGDETLLAILKSGHLLTRRPLSGELCGRCRAGD